MACPLRPAEVGAGHAGTARHARPLSLSGLTPQSPLAEQGKGVVRALRRASGKRSATLERARQVRGRREGSHTGRRFGDDLSTGNSKCVGSSDYDADFGLSHVDSFGNSLSSSDKENVRPGRKRALDDALFEFFRKEAIKSLKRDFAKFCNESVIFSKNKRLKDRAIGRDSFTSYFIKYFCEILKSLSNRRKDAIRNFGFGCLLLLEKCEIPFAFVRWICSCVNHVSHKIIVDDPKSISISKDSIHYAIGLPNSGSVPMPDSEAGAKFIMTMFGLAELPHITFFGNKLKSREVLTDKEVIVCFMVIAFKCFLFPTSNELPNTDYLSILQEPESASSVDLCMLVFEHLISGVYKYNKTCKLNGRKAKGFEFSYYILAVYYLDSLDFGARILDQSVPRISVWNGNLIKFFSDLDHTKNNVFGKRHLRKNLPSCYLEVGMQDFSKCAKDASSICFEPVSFSLGFKKNSHLRFGSTLESKIIDGIIDSVQSAITAKHPNVSKAELCVTNVLDFLKNLKCSEPNLVSAEAAIHNCEHVIPKSAASLDGNMKIKSPDGVMTKRAELCSVSTSPAMLPVRKVLSRFPHSVREDQYLLTSKTYPAGGNDSSAFLIHDSNNNSNDVHQSISFGGFVVDNNITSPISKINLSQAFVEKDVSAFLIPRGATVNKKRSRSSSISGSKEAPILVAETSPKALLNFPKVSNGSKNFRLRQVELATQSDDLYNKLINKAVQQDTHQPEINSQIDNNLDEYIDLSQNAAEERFPEDDTINNFVKLWKMIFKTYENIFRKFSVMYAKVPKQDNADDCGVFTMKFMEIFKPEVDTCSLFSKKDIIHIRIQFANQLYFCNRNNVDKSVVLNYKMQG
ncbi:hypothetical protein ACQ4PT_036653 [Festuca glaucescens]